MSRRKKTFFDESLDENMATYGYYIQRLTELSISMFDWKNQGTLYDQVTLYVPKGYQDAYANHTPWNQFSNIVEIDPNIALKKGVYLDKSKAVVKKKKTLTLKASVYPLTLADKSVKWKSSDKTIATVSSSDKVTGVKSGIVTITCTSVATGEKAT